jgi:hypothetical protein
MESKKVALGWRRKAQAKADHGVSSLGESVAV